MKITILGTAQSGQQQLFSVLTGLPLDGIQQKAMEVQLGICPVKDPRVDRLVELYKPKKISYARIEYALLPDFNLQTGPSKEKMMTELKNADEFCWVARIENAESDIRSFLSELIIADMMLLEKRLETIEKSPKKKYSEQIEKEKTLLLTCKKQIEEEKLLQKLPFSEEEQKALRTYQFLTLKPIILVINLPEDKINTDIGRFEKEFRLPVIGLSAELEAEISRLKPEEQEDFMKEMGIAESALHKMTLKAYEGLGLISFFTVGEDEVKAWTVRRGSSAPQAGSVIHSDIERGFVRAEMFKYEELLAAGSEAKLKETGKFHLKGRDYIVEDGDILSFRFNV